MNRTSQEILNSPELLGLHRQWMARLQDVLDGKESDRVFVLFGIQGAGKSNLYEKPEARIHEALDDLAAKADLLRDNAVFRPLSINPWPYGVHFIDKLFGADVFELNGEKENWQARMLDTPVGRLQPPDLSSHPAWSLARRLARSLPSEKRMDACGF